MNSRSEVTCSRPSFSFYFSRNFHFGLLGPIQYIPQPSSFDPENYPMQDDPETELDSNAR
jgi:hypothetical protein